MELKNIEIDSRDYVVVADELSEADWMIQCLEYSAFNTAAVPEETSDSVEMNESLTAGNVHTMFALDSRLSDGISDIEELDEDWDSYGAKKPLADGLELTRVFAAMFPPNLQPEVAPHRDGSIGLYWQAPGKTLCLRISGSRETQPILYFEYENGKRVTFPVNSYLDAINILKKILSCLQ